MQVQKYLLVYGDFLKAFQSSVRLDAVISLVVVKLLGELCVACVVDPFAIGPFFSWCMSL